MPRHRRFSAQYTICCVFSVYKWHNIGDVSGERPPQNPASARPAAVLPFRLLPDTEKVGSGNHRLQAIAVREYKQDHRHLHDLKHSDVLQGDIKKPHLHPE